MAQLIPFPRRRKEPDTKPLTADGRTQLQVEDLRAEDRRRMLENIAAFVFIAAFLVFSFWVIDGVMTYSKGMTCIAARLRSC